MSDHHVVCSTVLSTLSSSFSAYFKMSNENRYNRIHRNVCADKK